MQEGDKPDKVITITQMEIDKDVNSRDGNTGAQKQ